MPFNETAKTRSGLLHFSAQEFSSTQVNESKFLEKKSHEIQMNLIAYLVNHSTLRSFSTARQTQHKDNVV
jgi:hypothetical protein